MKVSRFELTLILLLLSMSLTFDVQAEPETWTVDDDGPADFHTIQEAINAANSGDTICVEAGIYYENVVVNKTVSLIGENSNTTIIDGCRSGAVVHVNANNFSIRGFTIRMSGSIAYYPPNSGIFLDGSDKTLIVENIIIDNDYGIFAQFSDYNIIDDNLITKNRHGIYFDYCTANTLRNNSLANTYDFGVIGPYLSSFIHNIDTSNVGNGKPIYYWVNHHDEEVPADAGYVAAINSTSITVRDLTLTNNEQGVLLAYSHNCTVNNVNISKNVCGIHVGRCSHRNRIIGNKMSNCQDEGIYVDYSDNNIFHSNEFSNVVWCISLSCSKNNTISNNNGLNSQTGFYLFESSGNIFYENTIRLNRYGNYLIRSSNNIFLKNNFIENTNQVWLSESINVWDDGYSSGGNYWSDYTGVDLYSGPYQNETGGDGIGDAPYIIDENNRDNYPLVEPLSAPPSIVGDLNNDGIVNLPDIVTAGKAFGSYPGHPRWDSAADMNNDGAVNIFDLVLIARNLGKTV